MPLDLADYENKAKEAVKAFWGNRAAAVAKQKELGREDQGERAGVTGGKNMDGFIALIQDVIRANGLTDAHMMMGRRVLSLPGFFRPTKLWDLLIINQGRLVAALELKSQVGPSFGNNFNNRTEEALGTAIDLWTAFREGAFGEAPRPFVGWLMLVEDAPESRAPVGILHRIFRCFLNSRARLILNATNPLPEAGAGTSLYDRNHHGVAAHGCGTGEFNDLSELTSLKTFITSFAGHIAAEAAR